MREPVQILQTAAPDERGQLCQESLDVDAPFGCGDRDLDRLSTDERAVAIIRSTIDLAHALQLRIVAEGVETPANLALIAELGCDTAQGYLLGKPLPAGLLFPPATAGAV